MRDTSLTAYKNTYTSGRADHKRFQIYDFIVDHPNCTRKSIHLDMKIDINIVCPRVLELLNTGLIFENGKDGNHYMLMASMAVAV